MNHYKTSSGERVSQKQIDINIRLAKAIVIEKQLEEFGYNFCTVCERNKSNTYLDVSHNLSVKKAKETGQTEKCWSLMNLEVLCRECHQQKDNLKLWK